MISRRWLSSCALCAGAMLLATDPEARAQAPAGLSRKMLNQTDVGPNTAVLQMAVDISPGFLVARHTHPGVETSYLIAGGGRLQVKGAEDRIVKAGDTFQVPREVPHALVNGDATTQLIVVYAVDKDKPLATPAPE